MKHHLLTPIGPYSLATVAGDAPGRCGAAMRADPPPPDGVVRAAFSLDGDWRPVGVRIAQSEPDGVVAVSSVGAPSGRAVGVVVERALGLDVDSAPLRAIARRDPVVRQLLRDRPGFRPRGFWSPYEAAVWAVLTQRVTQAHAVSVSAWLADTHGERVGVDGRELTALPAPEVLAGIDAVPGLPRVKVARLRSVGVAATEGVFDGARLRSLDVDVARKELMEVEGIGAFSADLVLMRGAQHPDVWSPQESVLHRLVRERYGLASDAPLSEVEAIVDRWEPLRSWVSVLLRSSEV